MTQECIDYIEQLLSLEFAVARDPNLIMCRVPAIDLNLENSQKILHMLREAQSRPERSLVLITPEFVIFGYTNRRNELVEESVPMNFDLQPA